MTSDLYGDRAYYGPEDDLVVSHVPKRIIDDNVNNLRSLGSYSEEIFTSENLDETLSRWEKYNRFLFKSWSLTRNFGHDGSLVRFYNNRDSYVRSCDFNFNLVRVNTQMRIRPNMKILLDEVNADLVSLDSYQLGGIYRYFGSTVTTDLQILIIQINRQYFGWLCLADQIFLPIVNKWKLSGKENKSLDIEQSIKNLYTIQEAIQYQRQQGVTIWQNYTC